jgi:Na+/H+ antiporter NhaD/arsenite permease-like protein
MHHVVEPSNGTVHTEFINTVLGNAILQEFVPFIVLLFSLYTISGGIRITGDLRARPTTNAAFMAVGGILASFVGTTGAAMLLIRPLLETNRERKKVAHTIVLFIFIVCNCGGCLLPIGDPPLFLGYLEGVPFLWTLNLWPAWLFVNGLLLAAYLAIDGLWFYPQETKSDIQ